MGGILAAAEEPTLASALTDIGTLVTKSVSMITGNSILFTIFCGGLMGIGFRAEGEMKELSGMLSEKKELAGALSEKKDNSDYSGRILEQGTKAREYYEKAIQGNANAQYELGECYYYGWGVEENKAEAVKWYRKAAEQGQVMAQYNLGHRYANGIGVEKNMVEAVKWLLQAAKRGLIVAKDELRELGYSK